MLDHETRQLLEDVRAALVENEDFLEQTRGLTTDGPDEECEELIRRVDLALGREPQPASWTGGSMWREVCETTLTGVCPSCRADVEVSAIRGRDAEKVRFTCPSCGTESRITLVRDPETRSGAWALVAAT